MAAVGVLFFCLFLAWTSSLWSQSAPRVRPSLEQSLTTARPDQAQLEAFTLRAEQITKDLGSIGPYLHDASVDSALRAHAEKLLLKHFAADAKVISPKGKHKPKWLVSPKGKVFWTDLPHDSTQQWEGSWRREGADFYRVLLRSGPARQLRITFALRQEEKQFGKQVESVWVVKVQRLVWE